MERLYMWVSVLASVMVSLGAPRELKKPSLSPKPAYASPSLVPVDLPEPFHLRAAQVVLDGWAFYARAGGMVVATGEATRPWIYGCDTSWTGDIPFCRIGRSTLKMPNHAVIMVGMAFITLQDAIRRFRAVNVGPRYKAKDIFAHGHLNFRALLAVLPLISFSALEHGAYGNILVTLD